MLISKKKKNIAVTSIISDRIKLINHATIQN